MKYLVSLSDQDIFSDSVPMEVEYSIRQAVKLIVLDKDNKIALVGSRYRLLPGGGVEEGETLEEAAIRECREEIGCTIKVIKEIGVTEEYRAKIGRRQETHCFLAEVVGEKGEPETIQEDEQGIQVEWFSPDEALALLEKEVEAIPLESYHSCFNVRTHVAFLKEWLKGNID